MPTNIHRNYTEKKTNYIFILPLLLILVSSSIYSCSKKKKIEPQILQVSPDVVWSGEDNQVEIFGKNFIEGAKLNIKEDKKEASIFSVYLLGEAGKIDVPFSKESEEKVKAVIKKGTTPGNYRIFVEIGNKQKASYPIKVLRLPIPYIEKISRDKVSNTSDQTIILEGKNFQEITKVYIGDKEAEFSFSETQVVIKIPPDFPPGDYEIKVVNSEGSYALYSKISVVEGAKIEYKVQKPQNIFANSNTQFSVQITNKGKVKANIKISLNIDGNIKQIQTEISPEETKEVNFDVFVSANLEFELIIEGEDELGGVFSISSKETMIANCSPEICDGKDNDCNGLVDDGVLITFYKDNDGDGYGDPNNSIQACSQPPQYVQNSDDCNDNNNLINPNTIWFKDYDGDGFTDGTTQISCQQPTGYVLNAIPGDCNDNNSNINPNTTWFKDADGDGFTDGTFQVSCVQPAGFVLYAPGGDCDDSDPARNPGQSEICDGKDNNCDGQIDEGVLLTFYRDQDGDGYGNANNSTQACSQPVGYVQNPFDCNDNNASIYPGAPLNCNNGQDNDCSGNIETWAYTDQDGDRYAPNNVSSCVDVVLFPGQITAGQELGYNDCNDTNSSIYPGAPLNCNNGQDNDCSGNIETWAYTDEDGDRYAPNNVSSCVDVVNFPGKITAGQELGYNDCNDNNASIYPGAPLNCNNGQDNDCSGNIEKWAYTDQDGDRYAPNSTSFCVDVVSFPGQITVGQEFGTNDCNDNNASIYPGAPLNCSNGQDNDCSGNIETWAYTDQDGDRYAPNNVSSCVDVVLFPGQITAGQELGYNDCNDTNSSIYPGAPLNCNNGQDNDCSGNVEKWAYTDQDGDRYAPNSTSSCVDVVNFPGKITAGQELGYNDCNDNNASIYPGAPLNCNNGQDNDCSGNIETWAYTDQDGDRYAPNSTSSCVDVVNFPGKITAGQELGYNDCNDNNASIYPGAPLNCNNGQDNDCSGNIETWAYTDQDGDRYAPNNVSSCVDVVLFPGQITAGQELGYNDCNDTNSSIYPGAPLNCNNGQDNDCSGNIETWAYTDQDGDRYAPNNVSSCVDVVLFPGQITAGQELGYNDCNDNNASIYPGAPLNCNNGQDNDCSGNIETWAYTDQDGDRYAPNSTSSCVDVVNFPGKITAGQELGYNDCNDNNASIYPGAPLNCNNGQDNDCSGNIETWAYTDQDGDRYAPNNVSSCVDVVLFPGQITAGQELGYNDCNDNNSAINPGASEVCNGIDDNCNGQADEGLASCEIPTCPTTISALSFFKSSTGDISISLSWNDPATNESGFVIEKSKFPIFSPSVSFVINTPNTTSYTLDFQEPLTQFYFRVYAFNPTGSCVPIATASTYTPPGLLWAFPLTGAPQDINGFAVNPKMFDINGDGKKEIIIADDQGYVYVISTVEYNFQISSIPLWISRPGVNAKISTPAIAVYQGNPTVVVSDQVNKKIHILGKDGNLVRTITPTQTPYPPIITDFNGDLLPDILVSIGDGGLVAYSFSGEQIFSVPAPGAEMFFFPSIFEYKGNSTYIVLGTNRKRIKGFSGNTEILNVDLSNLPFTNFNPFNFISTFKIGNLSHAAFSTQDGFLHIIRLVKNPLIKFNTSQNVVAKPLSYDFNNDGTPDIAINSDRTLFFIDGKTGNQICQFNLGSDSYSSPALLTDTVSVVVGTDGGRIYAIKPDCTQRWSYSIAGFQIRSSPLVADIDKDGAIEIVVGAESAAAGKIIILKSDGTLEREIVSLEPIRSSPKMGDMNGDGIYEVVIGTDQISTTGGVLILNCPTDCASSYNLTSYTATGWGKVKTTPLLYDLNSDGFLDIVFADDNQKLYAMSGTSINYSQPYLLWSANLAGVGQMAHGVIFPSSPTLFIKSGVPYIAIGSKGKGLYIVNGSNGSLDQQLFSGKNCFSSPATFDYNKDGVGDIVIGCDDNNVYFVSGTDYSTMRIEKTGGNIRGSPAIYDIDQDGFEDVGIGSDDNNLYVFNGVKIHLCSTNLGINLDHQHVFYKNKIVVSSDSKSYVISATDCFQISSIPWIAPSSGASFGVYMENNSPRLVVGTGNKVFVFDESFAQIYPFPFTYFGGSIASSPVLGDIDGDGSLEFSIAIAFSTGDTGTIFTYRITRDVDFSLEWREFAHDRYNSSFSEQKENSYFSPRYTSKPSDTENIYLTQEHKEKSAVGCSSFRETALLFLFFTLFIVRRKILFSRNQNLKRRKNLKMKEANKNKKK